MRKTSKNIATKLIQGSILFKTTENIYVYEDMNVLAMVTAEVCDYSFKNVL